MTAVRIPTAHLRVALVEYERWRLDLAGFSVRTWAGEKSGLLGFIDFLGTSDVHYVASISRPHVESWWLALTVADSTKATRLSQLRSFLKFCTERGWLAHDPSALLRAPRTIPAQRDRLDVAELLGLLEAVHGPRDRALLALCMNLALRGGEIQRLRIADVDLDAGEIKVQVDKTHESDVMPISSDLDAELRTWLTEYAPPARDSYLVPSQYVVVSTGRILYRHNKQIAQPYDVVKAALRTVGWEDTTGEGVHTVRRSVARIYFDMIEEIETFDSALLATMTLLHHTRPETTIRYIGRDRLTLARDRVLKGKPFLTKLAGDVRQLRSVK